MGILVATNDLCWMHDTGAHHPERPARLDAVKVGIERADLGEALTWVTAPRADRATVERVHPGQLMDEMELLCSKGGGSIDPDTHVSEASADAAWVAAGAGLDLIKRLEAGEAELGWSVVRPPGHHALPTRQMGFCLINNIAVAAKSLAEKGHRVAIVDVDAHHGNGTQEVFYRDPAVLFISLHQYPWYPYTGQANEVGEGAGLGTTLNIPLPAGTTGPMYQRAIENVVVPKVEAFDPDWLLISAGFDGHRRDPLTEFGLTSADYTSAINSLLPLVNPGRRLLFLEGGYDTDALADCAGSILSAAAGGSYRPEPHSEGSEAGLDVVVAAEQALANGTE